MTLSVEASLEAVSEMIRRATRKGSCDGEEEEDMLRGWVGEWCCWVEDCDWEKEDLRERRMSVFEEELEPVRPGLGFLVVVVDLVVVLLVYCADACDEFRDMTSIGRDTLIEAIGGRKALDCFWHEILVVISRREEENVERHRTREDNHEYINRRLLHITTTSLFTLFSYRHPVATAI